jgi:hypothetical protein
MNAMGARSATSASARSAITPGARGRLAALVLLVAVAGCARAVSIGTDPSPVYAVEVRNATGTAVNVFYEAGDGERVLGNVQAGATERFVVAGSARPDVRILARSAGGNTYGPYEVRLVAGATRAVVIESAPGAYSRPPNKAPAHADLRRSFGNPPAS